MKNFLASFFESITKKLRKISPISPISTLEEEREVINREKAIEEITSKVEKTHKKKIQEKKTEIISYEINPIRDVIDLMEFPFVALSKNRINPIIYENADKTKKIVISGHRGHFVASIYDWDIILVVAGKIQEILNNSEIPPQTISIPRHELLKALHKHDGKKQQKDLEKSLDRLKLTGISTTVNNKDYRHRAGFGFVDRWNYSERKNSREIRNIKITLSPWLYELCCVKGSLLKSNLFYFDITSGLKKFLYRTARKHAGNNKDGWEFTVESLYEKSGSEGSFKLFKSKIKKAVFENDIPDYLMEWREKNGTAFIVFKRSKIHDLDKLVEEYEKKQKK
jgi:plasmid replication initiation protein